MRVVRTEPVRQDLLDIFEYIATGNPKSARTLLAEIKAHVGVLIDQPQLGREGRVEGTRELVLTGTQYILSYRVQGLQNQVLAVFHGRREWPDQF